VTEPGPYTTITVAEFNHMAAIMRHLRRQVQNARVCLEKGNAKDALAILKFEDDTL
jgi:hypothetical protein